MAYMRNDLGRWLAIMALTATSAAAQDAGFDGAFKLRTGYGLSNNQEDHLDRRTLGLGFDFGYVSPAGRFGLELGYQYKPGNQTNTDLSAMPVAVGATLDPSQSVDSRKSQVGGLTLRASFERRLTGSEWSWRLGVQVGGAKFRQEYIGDVTDGVRYEDTYNGIVTKTTVPLSPFVGVGYAIDARQSIELNVISLGYSSANYQHVAGTVLGTASSPELGGHTAKDSVIVRKRSVPHLEFGYTLRF
ncbi:hypothetical protein GETHLI_30530 [Geothrix limicola]|uniref:Outer membrane protein beta-barrel domain-containing protein n=1 Tax=Geothrix limicola TaxID=2927978 RepID=A0ABQ5QJ11_9BACT|nr:outer membrane beta-barrel protein [Geothrix limicola]GLH74551.1 hypothetical protein GETHLI_30530 [Geothrix limicola]